MTVRLPSIQSRLILLVLGALLVVELVTAWTGYQRAVHEADELLDSQLAQYAQIILSLAHEGRDDEVKLPDIKAHHYQSKLMFQIWDVKDAPRLMLRSPEAPHHWPEGVKTSGYSEATLAGHAWRFFVAKDNNDHAVLAAHLRNPHETLAKPRFSERASRRRPPARCISARWSQRWQAGSTPVPPVGAGWCAWKTLTGHAANRAPPIPFCVNSKPILCIGMARCWSSRSVTTPTPRHSQGCRPLACRRRAYLAYASGFVPSRCLMLQP